MRRLLLIAALLLYEMPVTSYADIPRDPPEARPAPEQSAAPKRESGKAACGTGAAMVLAGVALYGVWRITKQQPREAVS